MIKQTEMSMIRITIKMLLFILITNGSLNAEEGKFSSAHPRWNPTIPSIGSKNLLPNSSFECGTDGWSSIGQVTGWGGDLSSLYGQIQKGEAFDGSYCLKIELGEGKTPVTHYAIYPSAKVVQKAPLVGNIGWLRVDKGASYTFSAYMRADRDNVPAKLVFWLGTDQREWAQPDKRYKDVILTRNWKRYSFTLTVEEPDVFISLGPDLTLYPSGCATVWIDAVQLEKGNEATEYIYREDVVIGFDSEKFGDVFSYPEPVNFKLFADNRTLKQAKIRFKVELTDYFDNRLPEIIKELTIPANSLLNDKLEMGISKLGHYRGTVSWEINNIKYAKQLKFAYIKPYKFNNSPFAINHAPTTEELCGILKKIGITWARDWSIEWNQLEPVEGKLSFEKSDYQIDRVLDAGMNIMALLPPFPSAVWASSAPENIDELMGLVNYPKEWHRTGFPPKDTNKLLAFIGKAINRYKDRVKYWEFLNEPIHTIYALPGEDALSDEYEKVYPPHVPADYVDLLKEAYETMKQADPGCMVIGGLQQAPEYRIDEFVRAGGLDYLDIYSIHPYGLFVGWKDPEGYIPKMEKMLSVMDASNAGRKPVWITECGYYAEDDKPWQPWIPPKGHFSANNQLDSEKLCADYLIRFSVIMLAHGVEKIFYHQGTEGQLNNGSMDLENPLLSPLARPTKFYAAHAVMAHMLGPKPKYAAALAKLKTVNGHPTDNVYGYTFQCGKQAVLIAWSSASKKDSVKWDIELPKEVEACNIVGNPIKCKKVPLSGSPVYIYSTLLPARELANITQLTVSFRHPKSLKQDASTAGSDASSAERY